MNRLTTLTLVLLVAAVLALALFAGCGQPPAEEPAAPDTAAPAVTDDAVVKTVNAADLENPDNLPVYVCPMEEHKDQVSLDPNAVCSLCNMKVVPMDEADAETETGE